MRSFGSSLRFMAIAATLQRVIEHGARAGRSAQALRGRRARP